MRIVHLKVTCQEPNVYFSKVKCTNYFWGFLILEQLVSTTIEISDTIDIGNTKIQNVFNIINKGLTLFTEGIFIYFQWYYILFFISKKKLKLESENKELTTKAKGLFWWLYFVLGINTLNYLIFSVLEMVVRIYVEDE